MSLDRRRIWWIVPAWITFGVDAILTLQGQSSDYWAGHFDEANEFNPLAHVLLTINPWLFLGLAILWGVSLGLIVMIWKHRGAEWLAMGIAFVHTIGGCTWMIRHGIWGWAVTLVYMGLIAEIASVCWSRER